MKTPALSLTVTTPVALPARKQLWAMAFMAKGLMVCTPSLPGMHEVPPAALHGKPANCNYVFAIVG